MDVVQLPATPIRACMKTGLRLCHDRTIPYSCISLWLKHRDLLTLSTIEVEVSSTVWSEKLKADVYALCMQHLGHGMWKTTIQCMKVLDEIMRWIVWSWKIEITSSQHCSMVERLVHPCKLPCACTYVWVAEGIEPKSNPQIHLELFQGIASDLQEVPGSDVSKNMVQVEWKINDGIIILSLHLSVRVCAYVRAGGDWKPFDQSLFSRHQWIWTLQQTANWHD